MSSIVELSLKRMSFERKIKLSIGIIFGYAFILGGWFLSRENPEIFSLSKENTQLMREAFNALVMMVIPFIFGGLASIGRLLISDFELIKNLKVVLASGMMASFSWIGIKSKIFISLLTPYVSKNSDNDFSAVAQIGSEFYSMIVVALFVGTFASNIFIFINNKIELITREK